MDVVDEKVRVGRPGDVRKDHPKGIGQERTTTARSYADRVVLRRLVANNEPNADELLPHRGTRPHAHGDREPEADRRAAPGRGAGNRLARGDDDDDEMWVVVVATEAAKHPHACAETIARLPTTPGRTFGRPGDRAVRDFTFRNRAAAEAETRDAGGIENEVRLACDIAAPMAFENRRQRTPSP